MIKINEKYLSKYTFIDLFAGIGGFHLALDSLGAKCIFSSEWDVHAANTYYDNFNMKPDGDITKISANDIPAHDILCAGFPCQAFSISGKQKGFEDTRGTLFFDIARIVDYHKPKVLFLENVKNLLQHESGSTIKTILKTLKDLGYKVHFKVLNASNYGLPQNRERIYIIGFRNDIHSNSFKFPPESNKNISLMDIIEVNPTKVKFIERDDIEIYKQYLPTKDIFDQIVLPNKPIQIGKVGKGGQGERIYHPLGHAITLSAYGGGVGSKTGLYLIDGKIRKLTPRECARLQGFPDSFIINSSYSQAYKQFGNSVSINVLQHILIEISNVLRNNYE